jgi:beta-lactamase regulating signal transducer with metallopeptidase domain
MTTDLFQICVLIGIIAVQLTTLDWVIVIVSIVLSFVPAIYLMRRASSSTTEFASDAARGG